MGLKELLEQITHLLFYPVLLLLVLLLAWALVTLGAFVSSALARYRGARPAQARYGELIARAASRPAADLDLRLEEILNRAENESQRSLGAVRFAVRAGPSLGLMGTLIPMAAALNGLAQGDLPALAEGMVVAFSSTIIGIAIGVVSYGVATVREAWATEDLEAIRLMAERSLRGQQGRVTAAERAA